MALEKEVQYKGMICKYHKIVQICADFNTHPAGEETYTKMTVKVALYVDETHRNNDVFNYLRLKTYHFQQDLPKSPSNEKVEKVYKALSKLSEFDGAIDV